MTRNQKKKIQATIRTGVKREFCANKITLVQAQTTFFA